MSVNSTVPAISPAPLSTRPEIFTLIDGLLTNVSIADLIDAVVSELSPLKIAFGADLPSSAFTLATAVAKISASLGVAPGLISFLLNH